MGIGAPLEGAPFVHVARLGTCGRGLVGGGPPTELECAGEGRGDIGCTELCCGTAGALSRATKERRNHEEVLEVRLGEPSVESFPDRSDCLRPKSRDDDDFNRRGSNASVK